jgi:hypothetical protein
MFPELKKVHHAVEMHKHRKFGAGETFTPIEDAFMVYFNATVDAGKKISDSMDKKEKDSDKK